MPIRCFALALLLLVLPQAASAAPPPTYVITFAPAQPVANEPVTMTVRTNSPIARLSPLYPVTVSGSTIRVTVDIFPIGPIGPVTDYTFAIGAFPAGQYTVELFERSISGVTPPTFPGSLSTTAQLTVLGSGAPVAVPTGGAWAALSLALLLVFAAAARMERAVPRRR